MSIETTAWITHRKAGWFVWLTLAVAITCAVIVSIATGHERTVMPAYQSAVTNWFSGLPLYNMRGDGFLYLPQAALTFAPWAFLPHTASELAWRWFIMCVTAASVARLTRRLNGDARWFFAISSASAVLAWGCARNGQSTLLITGLMILAVVDISESRWWRATGLLCLAFAFKPLAMVLILLAAVVYPRMSWRLAIGLLLVAIAPFATQRPEYVMSQYRDCVQSLRVTVDVGETQKWAQLFSTLQVAGFDLPGPARTGVRLLAAIATLLLCWKASRVLSPGRSAFYLYSLTASYLMLFNPRTEGSTYTMVGPVYGVLLAEAMYRWKNRTTASWMIAAITFTVLNYDLALLVSSRSDAIWIAPVICVGVTGYLVSQMIREIRHAANNESHSIETEISQTQHDERAAAA